MGETVGSERDGKREIEKGKEIVINLQAPPGQQRARNEVPASVRVIKHGGCGDGYEDCISVVDFSPL